MNITKKLSRKNTAVNRLKDQKIKEIKLEEYNRKCFDCQNSNPEYISLYNGIFICEICANYIHRRLDSSISLIIDNNLKNLSLKDMQYLYYGGNKKLMDFINYEYPILKSLKKNKLYLTKAMEYYRNWLKYLIYAGEKPVKPSFEESTQLIDRDTNEKNIYKNNEKEKENIINIDFLNNCYNYENDNQYKMIPNNYNTINKSDIINELRYSYTYENERQMDQFNNSSNKVKILNFQNMDTYNKKEYININNNNNNYLYNYEKHNTNETNFNTNKNKLITKRLSLKNNINNIKNNKHIKKKSGHNSISIPKKSFIRICSNNNNDNIYIKPKHTLLKAFQKNAISRNKLEKENMPNFHNSVFVPYGNNFQTILINNNIYDKLLMYNIDDGANIINSNKQRNQTNIISTQTIQNSIQNLNYSSSNENISNNHNYNNKKLFLKKKL